MSMSKARSYLMSRNNAAQRAKKLIDDHMVRTVIGGELP